MRDAFGVPQSLLVLGGSSEIALAIAEALIDRGTREVILAGRNEDQLEFAANQLAEAPSVRTETFAFEALAQNDHAAFVEEVFARPHDIDAVLFAFGTYGKPSECETNGQAAYEVVETNFAGAVSVAVPIVAHLRAQGHGLLIVLSSVAAERPRQAEYVYGASKAGLDAFFQGLADRVTGTGVRVLVVRPGSVRTKMSTGRPKPWTISPQSVARAIVRELPRNSHTVWVPAALRWVMMLVRYLPRPLFRRLTAAEHRQRQQA